MPDEPIVVARVLRAHGTGGGLLVQLETDRPEELLVPGRTLRVVRSREEEAPASVVVSEAAAHGTRWRLFIEGVADRAAAERLRGAHLALDPDELPALGEDEYFLHDLVGLEVLEAGRRLGQVDDVYELPAGPLLGVKIEGRERLIPFRDGIVEEVDLARRIVRVSLPEGLLDL